MPHASTAAESVRNLLRKNPKYSKRINYDALKDLFVDEGALRPTLMRIGLGEDEKGEDGMFGIDMDDKGEVQTAGLFSNGGDDDDGKPPASSEDQRVEPPVLYDADGDGDEDSEMGEEIIPGWEDAYEQEV
jgi:transcription factor IIIB 90 kDa subunit